LFADNESNDCLTSTEELEMNTQSLVALMAIFGHLVVGQEVKTSELFSFEKLGQYTSLASCFALIHEDFAFCNRKAEEKGKAIMEGVDENSEWAKRIKCCGTWKLRDCWVRFARLKCDPDQVEQVNRLPYTFVKNLETACADYPPGSDKCRFPVWLIVVLSIAGVALLAIGIFCGLTCYRRRRLRRRRQQLATAHEEQKLKKSSV